MDKLIDSVNELREIRPELEEKEECVLLSIQKYEKLIRSDERLRALVMALKRNKPYDLHLYLAIAGDPVIFIPGEEKLKEKEH